jgi:hypothetical protein
MGFWSKLKTYYAAHPIIIVLVGIGGIIATIVLLWSFVDLLIKAYNQYNTYSPGIQILIMTIISLLINIAIIILIAAYIVYKMEDSLAKKFKLYLEDNKRL